MISFGAGVMYAIPTFDSTGAAVAPALALEPPVQFGDMQDGSVDMSFEEKLLYGSRKFPIAVGQGKGKISGKVKVARFNGPMFGSLFLGNPGLAGMRAVVPDFQAVIPATPFQVTVTPPASGTFTTDLGVIDVTTGRALIKVASAPTAGQYSVSAGGQYTFAAADTGKSVLLNYEYTATSTVARRGTITNDLMGYTPGFGCVIAVTYQGQQVEFNFPNCVASKFSFPTKNDDFTIPEFEFSVFAGAGGVVGTWAMAE